MAAKIYKFGGEEKEKKIKSVCNFSFAYAFHFLLYCFTLLFPDIQGCTNHIPVSIRAILAP